MPGEKPLKAGTKLQLVKSAHTAIWAFFAILVLFILHAGVTDRVTPAVYVSAGLLLAESLVLMLCGWRCPLTILAYLYTDDRSSAFDIFLPEWLARNNKLIFGSLFGLGLLLVALRALLS
jgi:polyferredoxin